MARIGGKVYSTLDGSKIPDECRPYLKPCDCKPVGGVHSQHCRFRASVEAAMMLVEEMRQKIEEV